MRANPLGKILYLYRKQHFKLAKKKKGRSGSTLVNLAAFVIVIAGVMAAQGIITTTLLALFIGIICVQPVLWLYKRKVNHTLAVVIVLTGIMVLFFGLGAILGQSFNSFANDAPLYGAKLREIMNNTLDSLARLGIHVDNRSWEQKIDPGKIMNYTASILSELGGIMSNAFLIFFIVMFLLLERASLRLKAKVIARYYHTNNLRVMTTIGESIRGYLGLKTIISLITGVLIWLWLLIFDIDYALLWGMVAFLLNYIPNIGSIIAGVPAVLFALVQAGPAGAGWATLGYVVVNMVVGNIIEPRMMGKNMGLSTLIVFLSLIFWGFVLGTVGMFLSVPLTMVFKILLEQNPKTRWISILLGSEKEAKELYAHPHKAAEVE